MAEYVGIEVAKGELVIARYPVGTGWAAGNDAAGIAAVVAPLDGQRPAPIALAATGGDERPVVAALTAGGLPVAVVNPRRVRDLATARGRVATAAALDAQVLARFAAAVPPPARPPLTAEAQTLAAVLARRRHVVAMITMAQHRLPTTATPLQPRVAAHLASLRAALTIRDAELAQAMQADPAWQGRSDLRRGVPGVGPVLTAAPLADRPEPGTPTRRGIALLAGVAPLNADGGTLRGTRRVWGGRGAVRAARHMSALVATRHHPALRVFYRRLCAAGKPKKLALAACMRKPLTILTAMLHQQTPWRPESVAATP